MLLIIIHSGMPEGVTFSQDSPPVTGEVNQSIIGSHPHQILLSIGLSLAAKIVQ